MWKIELERVETMRVEQSGDFPAQLAGTDPHAHTRRDASMAITASDVKTFFDRYAKAFADGLEGSLEVGSLRALYATQYIAAGPTGVMAGNNDDAFGERMSDAYENYRRIGTKAMTINAVRMHPIDETHCLAHVDWNSEFEKDGKRIDIPFTNTYLIEQNDGALKVFGWITGDEVQLLKDNGLL